MKKEFVTLLALFMIFAFTACDSSVSDPFEGYAKITKDNASVTEITKLIENSSVKGIMSDDNIVVETKANEKISVSRDFGFYNVTFKAELPENSNVPVSDKGTETSRTHAINLSGKGTEVTFDHVLMIGGVCGNPFVEGAKVEAKVLKHGKNKKIKVYKYKQKKKYRRTQGHRQPYTKVEITKLAA